jgi:hypothetical protein
MMVELTSGQIDHVIFISQHIPWQLGQKDNSQNGWVKLAQLVQNDILVELHKVAKRLKGDFFIDLFN